MSAPNVKSPSTPQKGNKQQNLTLSELTKQVVNDIEKKCAWNKESHKRSNFYS